MLVLLCLTQDSLYIHEWDMQLRGYFGHFGDKKREWTDTRFLERFHGKSGCDVVWSDVVRWPVPLGRTGTHEEGRGRGSSCDDQVFELRIATTPQIVGKRTKRKWDLNFCCVHLSISMFRTRKARVRCTRISQSGNGHFLLAITLLVVLFIGHWIFDKDFCLISGASLWPFHMECSSWVLNICGTWRWTLHWNFP